MRPAYLRHNTAMLNRSAIVVALALACAVTPGHGQERFSFFQASTPESVERLLTLAGLRDNDVVVDLGSGDGLIPLTAASKDGRVVLQSPEGWELPLSDANGRKALSAKSSKVVLGGRHSTIKVHKSEVPGSVPGKVYTVEPTGDVTFVQAFLSGAIVNISVPPSVPVAPDEQIWLEFDQERMHLFDGETEMALNAAVLEAQAQWAHAQRDVEHARFEFIEAQLRIRYLAGLL